MTESLYNEIIQGMKSQLNNVWQGQHLLYIVAWLQFGKYIGVEYLPKLDAGLQGWDKASDTGWMWPMRGAIVMTERAQELHLDDFGRMHNETGPAIAYADGYKLWYWHGVKTTEKAIMTPELLTIQEIHAVTNAEERRVLVERMGYERYLKEGNIEVISTDFVDIQKGEKKPMPRCLVKDEFGEQFLFGTDGSTERAYFMPVPSTVKTCREAHEAICGLDESKCVAQS